MEHRLEHVFPSISAQDFWQLFFYDEAYGEAIHRHLEVEVVEMNIQCTGDDVSSGCRRTMAIKPAQKAPGFLSKLLSGSTIVREESHLDMAAGTMTTRIQIPTIGKRVDYGGTYTWRPRGEGFVRRWDGHCNARFPLISGKLERFFLAELEKSLEKAYAFTLRWISAKESGAKG